MWLQGATCHKKQSSTDLLQTPSPSQDCGSCMAVWMVPAELILVSCYLSSAQHSTGTDAIRTTKGHAVVAPPGRICYGRAVELTE